MVRGKPGFLKAVEPSTERTCHFRTQVRAVTRALVVLAAKRGGTSETDWKEIIRVLCPIENLSLESNMLPKVYSYPAPPNYPLRYPKYHLYNRVYKALNRGTLGFQKCPAIGSSNNLQIDLQAEGPRSAQRFGMRLIWLFLEILAPLLGCPYHQSQIPTIFRSILGPLILELSNPVFCF